MKSNHAHMEAVEIALSHSGMNGMLARRPVTEVRSSEVVMCYQEARMARSVRLRTWSPPDRATTKDAQVSSEDLRAHLHSGPSGAIAPSFAVQALKNDFV